MGKISENKYQHADYFDAKAEIKEYMRSLPIKTPFILPRCFMQNFVRHMGPQKMENGTYAVVSSVTPETRLPLLDADAATGKFVGPALADPAKFDGKTLSAAEKCYSYAEIARITSKSSGKTITYKVGRSDHFAQFLTPVFAQRLEQMMYFMEKYGYHGPGTGDLVKDSQKVFHGG